MKRPEKEVVVAELTEAFRNADAVYLTEYRGLTVPHGRRPARIAGEGGLIALRFTAVQLVGINRKTKKNFWCAEHKQPAARHD